MSHANTYDAAQRGLRIRPLAYAITVGLARLKARAIREQEDKQRATEARKAESI